MSTTTLELRSLSTPEGELQLALEEMPVAAPGPDEVVIRIEASPINPADQPLLLGGADLATLSTRMSAGLPVTTAKVTVQFAARVAARAGKSLPAGLEGAGVVVDRAKTRNT